MLHAQNPGLSAQRPIEAPQQHHSPEIESVSVVAAAPEPKSDAPQPVQENAAQSSSERLESAADAAEEKNTRADQDAMAEEGEMGMGQVKEPNPAMQQQLREEEMARLLWLSLPENDQAAYYSEPEENLEHDLDRIGRPGPSGYTNRDQKLRGRSAVRWTHRGKLGSWTEVRADHELQERENLRVNAYQRANVQAMLDAESLMPGGMGSMFRENGWHKRPRSGKSGARMWDPSLTNDLLGDDLNQEKRNALSAASLAPSLLLPVLSARALLESKLLKHNFRDPHLTALSRTALDLRESEHVMYRALGRCFGAMERIFYTDPREMSYTKAGSLGSPPPEVQEEVRDDAQREGIAQGHVNAGANAETKIKNAKKRAASAMEPMDITPPLSQINNIFITKKGLAVPIQENAGEEARTTTISPEEQRDIVYASLEYLNDLHSDGREYMERLDEIRSMLADAKWSRSQLWSILRRWALQRDSDDAQMSQMYMHGMHGMYPPAGYGSQMEEGNAGADSRSGNGRGNSRRNDWSHASGRNRSRKRAAK
ncbi:hypothetical protein MVES1_001272 [Malassezia vespertilionis]|uniref:uncharacterized protein n=1 Tax=Malassezia vespertilionis TaxID=2020962 RepID=UPI0024B24A1A|nr:uncharacterized protein MVES1_001272 [Malassezia vespertilionis]WFD05936.1 hypothetical protein MVES1_001272 [Malassezia vespertilionis]